MVNNEVQLVFEGREVTILTKEDVNFQFKGDFIISAKDVGVVLDYQGNSATSEVLKFCKESHVYLVKNSNMVNRHVRKLHSTGEKFISNFSLNRVMGQSGQPKAEKFQDWLYEDIVPTIQKHGMYAIDDLLDNPDLLILTATKLKEEKALRIATEKENEKLQAHIEEKKPLVTFAETALKSTDNILVRELSKIVQDEGINIGEKRLFDKLRDWKLILRKNKNNEPTQYAMNQKLFVVEEISVNTKYGTILKTTPRVTPKGQVYIINRLKKEIGKL
ncbi:phage antirepressor KilAC domain-containing protein [Paenibacillus polymyxa]|uniref:phage antirepressor KilAC domain-containing protein n=1 Tax=Paenibacillus polymyxa TaxID=1406 RepID=UPI0003F799F5|nr:phage antirepressor KilAC domain-containing protein [Paenibacillus polymyxa]